MAGPYPISIGTEYTRCTSVPVGVNGLADVLDLKAFLNKSTVQRRLISRKILTILGFALVIRRYEYVHVQQETGTAWTEAAYVTVKSDCVDPFWVVEAKTWFFNMFNRG